MTQRLACTECGELIVPTTAEKTGGLCMPCKGGYRERIEAGKRRRVEEREIEASPPARYWHALVQRVHDAQLGFTSLSPQEQKFFAVNLLSGEVYNGGFEQYFTNSSADYYSSAVEGLIEMNAPESLRLLQCAKELLFGPNSVPPTQAARFAVLPHLTDETAQSPEWWQRLEALDKEFWTDPDNLVEGIDGYAEQHELWKGF